MPRKFFKKILPDPQQVKKDKNLRFLGDWLHDPNIWHLNRRSVSGAMAIGLFMAFLPSPFGQTLAAALAAIFFRVNLPLSAVLVWLTNPLTMPPIYLLALKLGSYILGLDPQFTQFELSLDWFQANITLIWKPFVVGCLIMSIVAAVLGYFTTRLVWRWAIAYQYRQRKEYNRQKKSKNFHKIKKSGNYRDLPL